MKTSSFVLFFLIILFSEPISYAQKSYIFIGSYNFDKKSDGIFVYELDTTTGKLHQTTTAKDILNPSYLTLSPNSNFVYACTDTKTPDEGSVSSFEFNTKDKTLTFINSQKSGGVNPVYLSVYKNEKWLINANYTSGSVSLFSINKDGSINPVSQVISYADSSVNRERQDRSHIHATVFSPNSKYVFLPDLGADKIRSYQFDTTNYQPLQASEFPCTKATSGSGPRHFTFHPNGRFAYCIEELSGTINAYKYTDGKLDSIQRINTHSEKYTENFNSADIHISPDGKFLYASNRGDENNIAIFSIEQNGTLKIVGYQSTFGKIPRNFAIDTTGKFLIVANQVSGNIVVFKRNQKTGLLKKVKNKITVKNPSCVQIKQYE